MNILDDPLTQDKLKELKPVYSYGTAGVMATLMNEFLTMQKNVIAINLQTLLRNQLNDDEVPPAELARRVAKELQQFLADFASVASKSLNKLSFLVLYMYDPYSSINGDFLRPLIRKRALLQNAIRYLINNRDKLNIKNGMYDHNAFKLIVDIRDTLPVPIYMHLYNLVFQNVVTVYMSMVSHHPIDYHIASKVTSFNVLQSHTGTFVEKHQLGYKVFKNYSDVPFYPCTHSLFGDTSLLLPQLSPKLKKEIQQEARKDSWKTYSENVIRKKLELKGYNKYNTAIW